MKSIVKHISHITITLLAIAAIVLLIVKYYEVISGVCESLRERLPKKQRYVEPGDCCAGLQPNIAEENDF